MQRFILASVILIYLVLASLYATFTPKWQAPDEPAHFNYIRAIAETGALPVLQPGDYDQAYLEKIKAAKFPAALSIDAIRYEAYQPPLYYLAATPVYIGARAFGLDTTVIALRLFSVVLGALVLVVAFRCVHEIFPNDKALALATVGLMATIPQHLAVSASISNDLAAELILVTILWLAIRRAKNTLSNRRFVVYGGLLFGAGLLTKTTTYVPGATLLVAAEIARIHLTKLRVTFYVLRNTFHVFILSTLVAAPMFIRNSVIYGVTDPLGLARHDAVVLGQPTTAGMIAEWGTRRIGFDFLVISFKSFWAQFGWMGVLINDRLYVLLFALTGVALLGLGLATRRVLRHRAAWALIPAWGVGLLALLLATTIAAYIGYNFKFFQPQGRYLFPGLIAIAFFLVSGLREAINFQHERVFWTLLYLALITLDVAALFLFILPQLRT